MIKNTFTKKKPFLLMTFVLFGVVKEGVIKIGDKLTGPSMIHLNRLKPKSMIISKNMNT